MGCLRHLSYSLHFLDVGCPRAQRGELKGCSLLLYCGCFMCSCFAVCLSCWARHMPRGAPIGSDPRQGCLVLSHRSTSFALLFCLFFGAFIWNNAVGLKQSRVRMAASLKTEGLDSQPCRKVTPMCSRYESFSVTITYCALTQGYLIGFRLGGKREGGAIVRRYDECIK